MSSLKNGITKEIIKRKIYVEDDSTLQTEEFEEEPNKKVNPCVKWYKKIKLFFKNYKKNKIVEKMANSFHQKIVSPRETTKLFSALKRM